MLVHNKQVISPLCNNETQVELNGRKSGNGNHSAQWKWEMKRVTHIMGTHVYRHTHMHAHTNTHTHTHTHTHTQTHTHTHTHTHTRTCITTARIGYLAPKQGVSQQEATRLVAPLAVGTPTSSPQMHCPLSAVGVLIIPVQ